MKQLFSWLVDAIADLVFRLTHPGLVPLDRSDRRAVRTTIKQLRKLRQAGVYVYGATNRLRVKGSPLSVTLTGGGVTAGSPGIAWAGAIANGGICGVVESAKDGNNVAVLHTEGVWSLTFTVVTGIAVGDPVYCTTAGVLTQTAAGNRLFGYSLSALGAGSAAVTIKLAGSN